MTTRQNRWTSDLHWVRDGQQDRSRNTQRALLDAAEELFALHGVGGTSISDIAERAGSSVGSVYHHFRDKQALVYALFDRMCGELEATTDDAVDPGRWDGATISDVLHGYLEFSLATGRTQRAFKRLSDETARTDPVMRERLAKLYGQIDTGLTGLLHARRAEIAHPDAALAIDFVVDQLAAMLKFRLDPLARTTGLGERTDDTWIAQALRSAQAYLQLESSPTANGTSS
ncbi:MAG: TetR/AcrR family transcriptional regulator [Actinomycetota bacterium]